MLILVTGGPGFFLAQGESIDCGDVVGVESVSVSISVDELGVRDEKMMKGPLE